MLYKDKETFINAYYEKEVEVYKVFYTESGRDEDGIYGSYNKVEEFCSKEKAERFKEILKENSLRCSFSYSYTDICMDGPIKTAKRVYLNKEDMAQCMIQYLNDLGYKVTKEK